MCEEDDDGEKCCYKTQYIISSTVASAVQVCSDPQLSEPAVPVKLVEADLTGKV